MNRFKSYQKDKIRPEYNREILIQNFTLDIKLFIVVTKLLLVGNITHKRLKAMSVFLLVSLINWWLLRNFSQSTLISYNVNKWRKFWYYFDFVQWYFNRIIKQILYFNIALLAVSYPRASMTLNLFRLN